MPIDNLSKITSRTGISTTILLEAGNVNATGIITAAGFNGPFTGGGAIAAGIITGTGLEISGISTLGIITASGSISIGATLDLSATQVGFDNPSQIKLSDLVIGQHQNTGSYKIENGSTGSLLLRADMINFATSNGGTSLLRSSTSEVQIFAGNTARLVTNGIGATVFGELDVTGDVGIGTTNPSKRLHVADYGTHGAIRVEGSGNGNRSGIEFYRETSAGVSKGGAAIWVESDTSSSAGKLRFGTASNAAIQSQDTDMILDNNGRLGIGTDNPDQTLELFKASGTNLVKVSTQANSTIGLEIEKTGATTQSWRIADGQTVNGKLEFYDVTDSATRMCIDGAGRVFINRTAQHSSSSERLSVNGMTSIQNNSTSTASLYIFNEETTTSGNPIQPFLFCHDGSGIRAALGVQRSTGLSVLNGQFGLSFRTGTSALGGTERLRIFSNGRIAIGTDTAPRDMVHLHNPNANASSYIQFTNANTGGTGINDGTLIGISQNNSNTDGTGSGFTILNKENAEITLGTNGTERLRIASNGNVSIGNGDPTPSSTGYNKATLHIMQSNSGTSVGCQLKFSIADLGHNANDGGFISYWGDKNFYYNNRENLGKHRFFVTNNSGTNYEKLQVADDAVYVIGHFDATTKSFLIDHPTKENHRLRYACLEGPENSVYVRGRSSDSVIELPDYWVGLVHDDSITVNVTPIGNKKVWVESINNNSVTIGSDDSTEYFYTVFAERKDVDKLEVEVEN